MAYVADHLVIYACTHLTKEGEDNTIAPFIKYLEEGKEFTPRLRGWLVELLKKDGSNKHLLEYKKRRGRRITLEEFEQDTLIYDRASDLEGKTITEDFCRQFSERTDMTEAPDEYDPTIYRFGLGKRTITGGFPDWHIDVTLTLKIGKILNSDQIHKIVADEFGESISTVKRILRLRESLSYPGE